MGLFGCGPESVRALHFESHSVTVHGQRDVVSAMDNDELPAQSKARPAESDATPTCTAAAFQSPDPHVRLLALEAWAQEFVKSDDILRRALDDPDEHVHARALQLIEEGWVRELEELYKRQ